MNVFFVLDDHYIDPCMVMLNSLFRNNSGRHRIYTYSPGISRENQHRLNRFILKNGSTLDCRIFSDIGIDDAKMINRQWNPIVFYKLLGMLDIRDCERVLYLDCDIIVDADLSDFYGMDFGENLAVVVEDTGIPQAMQDTTYYMERLGIQDEGEYFNAGVLLLNLPAIQREMTMELFLGAYEENHTTFYYNEQDLLNMLWNGKVKYASHRYDRVATDYAYRDRIDADEDVAIYHYTMNKPWRREGSFGPEEGDYQWCVETYLKYCEFPEVSAFRDRIVEIDQDHAVMERTRRKLACHYNPFRIDETADADAQRALLLDAIGEKDLFKRYFDAVHGLGRQDAIIDFLMRLYQKGGLDAKSFFKKKGIRTIAIYGVGKICKLTAEELVKAAERSLFVDRYKVGQEYVVYGQPYRIHEPTDRRIAEVDAVIITSIGFEKEIVKDMRWIGNPRRVIPIERMLFAR